MTAPLLTDADDERPAVDLTTFLELLDSNLDAPEREVMIAVGKATRVLPAAYQPVIDWHVARHLNAAADAIEGVRRVIEIDLCNPLTDEARGFRHGALDALRDAARIVRDATP